MALPERHKTKPVNATTTMSIELPDEAATARLAARLAERAQQGDVIALKGDLGTGKTSFARAFIRALGTGDDEVPSPTFTLVEIYAFAGKPPVWHFDLYRLRTPEDAYELGIEDALAEGVSIIEWPERLGSSLPEERLLITLQEGGHPSARRAEIIATPTWAARLQGIADE